MSRRTYTTPLLVVGMLALAGCPDDVPADTEGTTGDTTTDTTSVGPTTNPMTTTVDPDSTTTVDPDSTSGGAVCEPVCAAGECCVGGFCFAEPAPTCPGACGAFEQCLCPAGSDPCDCEASCVVCGVEGGTYDSCLGVECPAGSFCVLDDPDAPTFGWCAQQGCGEDDCACPLPDAGTTAVPACGAFDGDEGNGSCFLDCSETDAVCPEGMICRTQEGQSACVWPGEGIESNCCFANGGTGCDDPMCQMTVCDFDAYCCDTEWDDICVGEAQQMCGGLCPIENAQPQYGDCINVGDCDLGLTCVSDMAGTFGWCATLDCMDDMECQPPPATGDAPAACIDINGMGTLACGLDCSMGQTCPDGMVCFMDFVCVWQLPPPPPPQGYNPCVVPDTGCAMGETCIDDGMMAPAWEVCAQDCVDVADCTLMVPPTGDAPVTCGDPGGGGADVCYLDCAGGQTCPDGMECTNGTLCAWPQVMALFEDDFETGDLSMGWTLADVDGLVPNMNVDYVDAAWVVVDDGAANNAATSTSWYEPVGMSDDWLISPAIMAGPNTWLFWASLAVDPAFPDNLEVLVSTMGNTPADFTDPPVLTLTPESSAGYASHSVSLAAAGYTDTQVYIAFRNTTNDGFLLRVDNVSVVDLP